jgi:hypothetical protein
MVVSIIVFHFIFNPCLNTHVCHAIYKKMESYNNIQIHYYTYDMRKKQSSLPVLVTKTQSLHNKLHNILHSTVNECMRRYMRVLTEPYYVFWLDTFIDIISDEIDGYLKHQFSHIPSSFTNTFVRYVEKEFNTLIVPVCERYINRDVNSCIRQSLIKELNNELNNTTCENVCRTQRCSKVQFNLEANKVHEF